jgi:hypothetical protein
METSLYYTFSTIAQTLAGFLALSSVFVLYQIQRYSHIQSVLTDDFVRNVSSNAPILPKFLNDKKLQSEFGDFSEIAESLIAFSKDPKIATLTQVVKISVGCAYDLKFIESKKNILLTLTKTSIISGVTIILYSFLTLANVPTLILSYISYVPYLFAVGIGGATVSILFMLIGIIISLKK